MDLLNDQRIIYKRTLDVGPTVFLIDEHHNHNFSTDNNIEIARDLISNNSLRLIGVESHYGGYKYDNGTRRYENEYCEAEVCTHTIANTYTRFIDELSNENVIRIGVESEGLSDQIVFDAIENPIYRSQPYLHVNSIFRSIHFIITLFEEYKRRNIAGNLMLNCGSNHNNHIQMFIEQHIIDGITLTPASYYRIRSTLFPNQS